MMPLNVPEDNQEGNDGDQTGNLGQNQIGRGIDTHNFECIDLLCGAHRAQL